MKTKIYIASDHAGYETKEELKKFLEKNKIKTTDFGTFDKNPTDYPEKAAKVAKTVASEKNSLGVLVCGTGIGMSIAANKTKGIRAANPFDKYTAKAAREHNHANIICLGGRTYNPKKAKEILKAFLKAKPSKEKRHLKRIKQITEMEK
jgi:ribose 5-phosphate isomerase B